MQSIEEIERICYESQLQQAEDHWDVTDAGQRQHKLTTVAHIGRLVRECFAFSSWSARMRKSLRSSGAMAAGSGSLHDDGAVG